jgi:hypothetical protein
VLPPGVEAKAATMASGRPSVAVGVVDVHVVAVVGGQVLLDLHCFKGRRGRVLPPMLPPALSDGGHGGRVKTCRRRGIG